uniref:hypothetical protein n=1 Tax=Candidatus Wujingus californicus TaxID=3367618 RepID=UPI0040263ACC
MKVLSERSSLSLVKTVTITMRWISSYKASSAIADNLVTTVISSFIPSKLRL